MHLLRSVVDVVLAFTTLLRGESLPELALGLVHGLLILAGFVASGHGPNSYRSSPAEPADCWLGSFDGQELGGQVRTVSSSPKG
jgi:hypothetical protein